MYNIVQLFFVALSMHARSGAGTFACAREESTGSGSELPRAHLFVNLFDGMYFVVFLMIFLQSTFIHFPGGI